MVVSGAGSFVFGTTISLSPSFFLSFSALDPCLLASVFVEVPFAVPTLDRLLEVLTSFSTRLLPKDAGTFLVTFGELSGVFVVDVFFFGGEGLRLSGFLIGDKLLAGFVGEAFLVGDGEALVGEGDSGFLDGKIFLRAGGDGDSGGLTGFFFKVGDS